MQYQPLGKSDLLVSSIGLGCVTFGREIDEATSFDVLDRAVERGINLLDTAAVYGGGSSETVIGRWLRARGARKNLVIATKVSGRLTRNRIMDSAEGSLRRLGIDQIDLLQAHDWDERTPLEETLAAFDKLVRRGDIRFCGCSNWEPCHLEEALSLASDNTWPRLESVQPPYSLVERRIEQGLIQLCGDRGLGIIAYSPLAAGFLTGKYRRDAAVPSGTRFDVIPGHQRIYFTDDGFRVMEGLRALADEVDIPMPHLALAWVLKRPSVSSVLIGARHPRQVDQAFEAVETELPSDIWDRVEKL